MLKKLLANTSSSFMVLIVMVVITFIMTPVYLRVLGRYDYGVWEILATLIGYMGILDIGIQPTVGRYIAKHHAQEDAHAVRKVYSTSCLFMLCMGLLSAALLLSVGNFWLFLSVDPADIARYQLLISLAAICLVVQFPSLVIDGAFEGFQKYTLKNTLFMAKAILVSASAYYLIELYDGLLMLALISTVGVVLKYFAGAALLRMQRNGGLSFDLSDCSLEVFLRSLRFGVKSFIQGIASRIHIGSDRLIIGYFLGPAVVPLYAIPANLIGYIRNIGWTITDAFMPYFTSLEARNEQQTIRQVYLAGSRYCIGLLLPMSIGAVLLGGPFISVWLGEQYRQEAEIIILLLVLFTMLPFFNPFSTRYLTALGKHGLLAKLLPVAALLNIIFSLILVQSHGIAGVAMGTLLPTILVAPIILRQCCRYLGVSTSVYIRETIVPALIPALVLVIVVGSYRHYSMLTSYTDLLIAVTIGAFSYISAFFVTGLQTHERSWLIKWLTSNLRRRPVS